MQELPSSATERILQFRGEYGRLCVLQAAAMRDGRDKRRIQEAARGMGAYIDPRLTAIRKQRLRVDRAIAECAMAGTGRKPIIAAAGEALHAVEQEWECRVPMVSDGRVP